MTLSWPVVAANVEQKNSNQESSIPKNDQWWRYLINGALSGIVSRTCTAPLDRLKVFLQVQSKKIRIIDAFRLLIKEDGWAGMWRGNCVNLIKTTPELAIKFTTYEYIKRSMRTNDDNCKLSVNQRFVAGGTAGGIAQVIMYPMEVIKTRLMLSKPDQFNGLWDVARKLYKQEGLRSFYRGFVPNLMGILPCAGIDLAVYETLKLRMALRNDQTNESPNLVILWACGCVSGAVGQTVSYPLLLIRTRLQAGNDFCRQHTFIDLSSLKTSRLVNDPCASAFVLVKNILRKDGFKGLYRGLTSNFIKTIPSVSISYVVYEYCNKLLDVKMTI